MIWKFEGSSPVYLQIMDHVRRAVLAGEYKPGDQLPSTRDFAAQAKVNPNTMQRALMSLEQEGLLVTAGTAGRFVTDDPQVLAKMRIAAVDTLVRQTAERFRSLGVELREVAQRLLEMEKEDENANSSEN